MNMSFSGKQFLFPLEIIKETAGYLTDQKDQRNFQLVNKSWYLAVTGGHSIQINMRGAIFGDLSVDLEKYPTFGPKISCIKSISKPHLLVDLGDPIVFEHVLARCPNLLHLHFAQSYSMLDEFMNVLKSSAVALNNIQKIETAAASTEDDSQLESPAAFYFESCVKFQNTLTYLEILEVTLRQQYNGLLANLLLSFPHLKHLVLLSGPSFYRGSSFLYLDSLFNSTKINLEHIQILGSGCNVIVRELKQEQMCTTLKRLDMDVHHINTNTLKYIMRQFIKLESLNMKIWGNLFPSYGEEDISHVIKETLNQFKMYCSALQFFQVCIKDQCGGQTTMRSVNCNQESAMEQYKNNCHNGYY